MGNAEFTIGDLLGAYPPPVRAIAERLRKVVLFVAPEAKEKANKGWRSISYSHPEMGYFCGVFPFEDHVDLIFEFGALLPDPEGMLLGDAKQVRFLRFHDAEEIRSPPIERLLKAALALPPTHSLRRGMTQAGGNADRSNRAERKKQPRKG